MAIPTWQTDAGPIEACSALTAARRAYGATRRLEVTRVAADGDTWDVFELAPDGGRQATWLGVMRGRPTHSNASQKRRKKVK